MYRVKKEVEVRYAETDQMGVVYHANYLIWLELGRTALIDKLGYNYVTMETAGFIAPIVNVELEYKHAAVYGEVVTVETGIKKVSPFRTTYVSEIYNQAGVLCLKAEVTATCVSKADFKLRSFKKIFPEWFKAYQDIAEN
ncbi:MAG: acyl-CoA thioesterase [Culicoidibacterales bacterium]